MTHTRDAGPVERWRRAIDANLLNELRIAHDQREDDERPRRWPWIAGAAALLVLLLAGAGWWWLSDRPLAVQTAAAVAPGGGVAAGAVLQATGYVTARRQATVSTQITGTLTQVLIEEGDHVKAGQVIARLDDSALRANLHAAQANAQAAQATVAQMQAQHVQAEADARRQSELLASGMITRQAAEQSRTAVNSIAAQLNARQREAEAARAQLAQAKVNFDYAVVRAPFSGVVTDKSAQVGEIISPLSAGGGFTRTGVGTIVDMEALEVDVDVNEACIGQVSANAAAPTGVLVPPAAIVQRDGRSVVFVVADGKALQRGVTPAPQDIGQMKLVPQALAVGERVVLSPPATLRDGASVKIEEAPR